MRRELRAKSRVLGDRVLGDRLLGDTQIKDEIYLYSGKQAVDLRIRGLQLEPIFKMSTPFDWQKLFRLIFK